MVTTTINKKGILALKEEYEKRFDNLKEQRTQIENPEKRRLIGMQLLMIEEFLYDLEELLK